MNPYIPLYSNINDQLVVWLFVLASVAILAFLIRNRFNTVHKEERYYQSIATAFLLLNIGITLNFLIGYIFLIKLRIVSAFWIFWQLAYLLSIVAVFWVFPILVVALLIWSSMLKHTGKYSWKNLSICFIDTFAFALNVFVYFGVFKAFENMAASLH